MLCVLASEKSVLCVCVYIICATLHPWHACMYSGMYECINYVCKIIYTEK